MGNGALPMTTLLRHDARKPDDETGILRVGHTDDFRATPRDGRMCVGCRRKARETKALQRLRAAHGIRLGRDRKQIDAFRQAYTAGIRRLTREGRRKMHSIRNQLMFGSDWLTIGGTFEFEGVTMALPPRDYHVASRYGGSYQEPVYKASLYASIGAEYSNAVRRRAAEAKIQADIREERRLSEAAERSLETLKNDGIADRAGMEAGWGRTIPPPESRYSPEKTCGPYAADRRSEMLALGYWEWKPLLAALR